MARERAEYSDRSAPCININTKEIPMLSTASASPSAAAATGVFKFGGTSVATLPALTLAAKIITDRRPHCVVVSAPGSLEADPRKVTDLLIAFSNGKNNQALGVLRERFMQLCRTDSERIFISTTLNTMQCRWREHNADWFVSRGEYLMAHLMAMQMGLPFVDAANIIRFRQDAHGHPELDLAETTRLIRQHCHEPCVIPGFYGAFPDGTIVLLGRGGSDTTGALIASALNQPLTKWTDVDGFYTSDPRHGPGAQHLDVIDYAQALELSAKLIHPHALRFCAEAGVQITVRSTFAPDGRSTRIANPATAALRCAG